MVKSGQKRRIYTPGVNRNVSPSSICDPIDQNTSKYPVPEVIEVF